MRIKGYRAVFYALFTLIYIHMPGISPAFGANGVPKIVVLGDSLVAGHLLPPGTGFVDRLQTALDEGGVKAEIISAGVSGDTSSGGLARLDWSVPDDTDAVILEFGGNDGLRGLPVETLRSNLIAMIERLNERGIEILFIGMRAPPNMGEDYQQAFDAVYPELAEKYGLQFYPFFLDGVAAEPLLNLADGIHPNEKGIDVIVSRVLPFVTKLVENLSGSNDS